MTPFIIESVTFLIESAHNIFRQPSFMLLQNYVVIIWQVDPDVLMSGVLSHIHLYVINTSTCSGHVCD